MYRWINLPPDATWPEISTLFVELYKTVSHSILDKEIVPVVYTNVPSVPIGGLGFGVDFAPQTILTSYYVQTRKGNYPYLPTLTSTRCLTTPCFLTKMQYYDRFFVPVLLLCYYMY